MKSILIFAVVLMFTPLVQAMNMSSISNSCHCFKDRDLDPKRKFATDSYLLTTSFNSFIAANFHISKSQIVMMKMKGGVDPDDLLIALFVSRAGGIELKTLFSVVENGGSWEDIFASKSLQVSDADLQTFTDLGAVVEDKEKAGELVTDSLLKDFFSIGEQDISSLRREGATGREITLVYLLEKYGKRDAAATEIYAMYGKDKMSWGEIAAFFGLTPNATGKLLLNDG